MKFIETVADNKDFYPTPAAVVKKMLDGIKLEKGFTILEPSAGDGSIVFQLLEAGIRKSEWGMLYNSGYNIDCIESDARLQAVLQSKIHSQFPQESVLEKLRNEYKKEGGWETNQKIKAIEEKKKWHETIKSRVAIVHNDFLTFKPYKNYDLIVMNPPFSDGDKHLLKALEVQKKGGKIVCLLNAETLKNAYSKTRKELCRKLKEYGAEVEYIKDAFLDADRKTGVEIALVKVDIPASESFDSSFFQRMEQAKEAKQEEKERSEIITADFLESLVQRYQIECREGLEILKRIKEFNKIGIGTVAEVKTESEFLADTRRAYWKALLKNNAFSGKLTAENSEEFEKKIEEFSSYEFCMNNIKVVATAMNSTIFDGIKKALSEMFDKLTAEHSLSNGENTHYYNGWATNQAHKIGKKSVLWYGNTVSYSSFDLWKAFKYLRDIELCFQYLDGSVSKGSEMRSILEGVKEKYNSTGDANTVKGVKFEYFTATFYKKGTCHIVYTRPDLVDKFNIYIGKTRNWLPNDYGKKNYSDMTAKEKSVVDSFHADMKSSYSAICEKADFFLENIGRSLVGIKDKKEQEQNPELKKAYEILENFAQTGGKACAFVPTALNAIYNLDKSSYKKAFERVTAVKKIKESSDLYKRYMAL